MTVLSEDDREFLAEFFRRALELHGSGAVTTDSALEYLTLVVSTVDFQTPDAIQSLRAVLEDAWREDDA